MKRKYFLTSDKKGHFYLNDKDVTSEWHNFFSGLGWEREKGCEREFIKRYAKKLLA